MRGLHTHFSMERAVFSEKLTIPNGYVGGRVEPIGKRGALLRKGEEAHKGRIRIQYPCIVPFTLQRG